VLRRSALLTCEAVITERASHARHGTQHPLEIAGHAHSCFQNDEKTPWFLMILRAMKIARNV